MIEFFNLENSEESIVRIRSSSDYYQPVLVETWEDDYKAAEEEGETLHCHCNYKYNDRST